MVSKNMRRISKSYLLMLVSLLVLGIINPLIGTGSTSTNMEIKWEHYFGGSEGDAAHVIIQSVDGGFSILGLTESYGAGLFDSWLIKTNASGHHEWNKTFGGSDWDWPSDCLIQTQDDGYAFVGHHHKNGWLNQEIWLIKTDNNGVQEWNYTVEGQGTGSSLIQTADGGYVLSGKTVYNSQEEEYEGTTLLKVNSEGESVWNQSISDKVSMGQLIQTIDGGYALFGNLGEYPDLDFLLTKIDSTGQAVWNKTYSRENFNDGAIVIQLADGGFVLAGKSGQATEDMIVDTDIWLIKTDATGNPVWNTTLGTSYNDEVSSMIQTDDGGFFMTRVQVIYPPGLERRESTWLVKTDSDCKLEWEMKIGEENKHVVASILQTADGEYVLAGSTGNPLYGGAGDVWLTKIRITEEMSSSSSIKEVSSAEFLLIFPVLAILALIRRKEKK